ncbi:sigma-70 family RNA polymerase sigma factor [Marivirga sp. S37H4]|uniref:Sigma-70 family RNA polymerase sigma factor n=1 Tax=Marivirga aurantiaca TaxID=2802615 RepID=A0A934WXQ0_9BACT|nr:sigma-70 family RNA polymerase sigma factor [Marivirga aurantiaca]MBK6264802.1 sigma-70 family RNA polymerase sigma factor [Marivirga aurantiaca]
MKLSDAVIIERIKAGDESALDYLYKKNYRMMVSMILRNNGSEQEALDVFQDALIVFWQKAKSEEFKLSSKISTYLFSVCQNLWRKELDRKRKFEESDKEDSEENNFEQQEMIKIIHECINELGDSCKQILTYHYFDGMSMDKIAEKMGLANSDTAKTKRYKCKKRLDDLIRSRYTASDFLD